MKTIYECVNLDALGTCDAWEVVENEFTPTLNQEQQYGIVTAILSIMVIVWLFKMLRKAI